MDVVLNAPDLTPTIVTNHMTANKLSRKGLAVIRQATRRLHGQLDRHSLMSALVDPHCEMASYKKIMQALAHSYHALDAILLATENYSPEGLAVYQPRLPFLLADLAAMNIPLPEFCEIMLRVPQDTASYLGMRYVVEGAQLGGRVIERNLSQTVLLHCPNAGSFWSPSAPWQGGWPRFIACFDELLERTEMAHAAQMARHVFTYFLQQLMLQEASHV